MNHRLPPVCSSECVYLADSHGGEVWDASPGERLSGVLGRPHQSVTRCGPAPGWLAEW
ncbi:MAG TPA: hypothetical protein VHF47_11810 [Acidimicrobiales bacterium]|nr:hypothetical protein [Acidimicrobiales bacterium]